MIRRIAAITGTRADYGLMEPVYRLIADDAELQLHLIVTGMHLLPEFASGLSTVREQALGALHEVSMMLGEDSPKAMVQGVGLATFGMAHALNDIKPDVLLLHGDRGEMLAGAVAAAHMNIPLVHMSGGDVSGSIDDSVRNAISKLAHIHLTSCSASTQRLIAMGEPSARIIETGDPALDQIRAVKLLTAAELEREFGLSPDEPFLLATLHPVTDEFEDAGTQMATLLDALEEVGLKTVMTYPNSDAGGRVMRQVLESWRAKPFLRIESNLGSRRYLSLLRHAVAVVGNSSSGIIEAPSFGTPTVNVGSRQTGRLRAENVIDVDVDRQALVAAIRFAVTDREFRSRVANCRNPYGDGRAAERTRDVLKRLNLGPVLTAKWKTSADVLVAGTPVAVGAPVATGSRQAG
jgi:GDP/UDP-N,N'-diacetylbacillosamine 2-epimerase (hydrolysing)